MIQIQRVRSEQGTCMPWGISTESNLPPPTSLNQSPLGVYGRLLCGRVGFLRAQLWYIMITYYIHTLALLKTKTLSLSTISTYTCFLYKTIIFYIISPPAIITISYFLFQGHTAWAPVSQNDPSSSDGNNSGANSSFSMGSWGGFGNNNSQNTPAANPVI